MGGIDGSCISGISMDADEDEAIRREYLLFQDTEDKTFLLLEKCNIVWSCRPVVKIENVVDVVTSSSGKELAVP